MAVVALLPSISLGALAQSKPNIVVIMTDDQDDLSSVDLMPNLKTLVQRRGVTFTNSFVDYSLCCPSRATFLSGQSAINHRVLTNDSPQGGYYKFQPREANSLGVWLQQAGYVTALAGKVLNEYGDVDPTHVMPGWDEWYGLLFPSQAYFSNRVNENGIVKKYGPTDYATDVLTGKAVGFIEKQKGSEQPFFLFVTPPAPHDSQHGPPRPAPRHDGLMKGLSLPTRPNFNELDVTDKPAVIRKQKLLDSVAIARLEQKFQKRAEALLAVDEMVRDIVAALRSAGKLDNTVIIFTSDNGDSLGSHRWEKKYLPYEEVIRVPLLIRGPGIPKDETRQQLVNNVDLSATIVTLAGAIPGNLLDGRSLLPIISDPKRPWRTVLGIHGFERNKFKAVRTRNLMFAQYDTPCCGVEEEFYELTSDPYQMTNRISDQRCEIAITFLRKAAETLASCAGTSCWIEDSAPGGCR